MTLRTLTGAYALICALGAPLTNPAWGSVNGWHNAPDDRIGDAGASTDPGVIRLQGRADFGTAASLASVDKSKGPKLKTLVSFGYADGESPEGSLIADAAGDLFGTTYFGGADSGGTVFEVVS